MWLSIFVAGVVLLALFAVLLGLGLCRAAAAREDQLERDYQQLPQPGAPDVLRPRMLAGSRIVSHRS